MGHWTTSDEILFVRRNVNERERYSDKIQWIENYQSACLIRSRWDEVRKDVIALEVSSIMREIACGMEKQLPPHAVRF